MVGTDYITLGRMLKRELISKCGGCRKRIEALRCHYNAERHRAPPPLRFDPLIGYRRTVIAFKFG
jgi:hypothetical protein